MNKEANATLTAATVSQRLSLKAKRDLNILSKEYATFRPDIIQFFIREAFNNAKSICDPMSGTAPLIPYIEHNGLKASFNDINPLHALINKVKTLTIYKEVSQQDKSKHLKEIAHLLSGLKTKKLIVSDNWISDNILNGLISAWGKTQCYGESLSAFYRAIIVLCSRPYSSFSESYSNKTWFKPGGMSTERNLNEIIKEQVDKIYAYYNYYYYSCSDIKGGNINFTTIDLSSTTVSDQTDVIFTSPAYPNRFDYLRMYAPELYFLSKVDATLNLDKLKNEILGTNTIKNYNTQEEDFYEIAKYAPSTAELLLEIKKKQINNERTSNYYFRYFTKYFSCLYKCVDILLEAVQNGAKLYLVIQNNIHRGELIDLGSSVIDYCNNKGFKSGIVFQEARIHQGRRNISANHPLVLKKHFEYIVKVTT